MRAGRTRRKQSEDDAERAERDGDPRRPAAAASNRPDTARGAEKPDEQRDDERARLDRRQREEEGKDAEQHPEARDPAWPEAQPGHLGAPSRQRMRNLLRELHTPSTSTSAPTKSSTSAWIISVRLAARAGGNTV